MWPPSLVGDAARFQTLVSLVNVLVSLVNVLVSLATRLR